MGKYVVRRLLWMVVVLFFVSIITFLLAFAVPGDPAKSIAGTHATPEVLRAHPSRARASTSRCGSSTASTSGISCTATWATATRPSCR